MRLAKTLSELISARFDKNSLWTLRAVSTNYSHVGPGGKLSNVDSKDQRIDSGDHFLVFASFLSCELVRLLLN